MKQSPENRKRAKRAEDALFYFKEKSGYTREQAKLEGMDTNLTDLIADLLHFCDWKKIDFANQERIAMGHYTAEKLDPSE